MVEICQRAEKTEAAAKEEPGRLKKFGNLLLEGIRGLGTGTRKLLVYGAVATTLGLTACPKPPNEELDAATDADSDVDSDVDTDADNDVDIDNSPMCEETTECSPLIDPRICEMEFEIGEYITEGWFSMTEPFCSELLPIRFVMTDFHEVHEGEYEVDGIATDRCDRERTSFEVDERDRFAHIAVDDEEYVIYLLEAEPEDQRARIGVLPLCYRYGLPCCIAHEELEHVEGSPPTRITFDNVYLTVDYRILETDGMDCTIIYAYDRTTNAEVDFKSVCDGSVELFVVDESNHYLLRSPSVEAIERSGNPGARATVIVSALPRDGCDCDCACTE